MSNADISKIIYDRRTELEMSMQTLADKVGVSKSTIKKWESGQISNMRRDKIDKVATALKISPASLMGWEKETDFFEMFAPDNNGEMEFLKAWGLEPNVHMNQEYAEKFNSLDSEEVKEIYDHINDIWKRRTIAKLKAEIAAKEAELKKMEEGN